MKRANLASRIFITLIWVGLPACWFFGAPQKYVAALSLVVAFMIYSQGCQAFIHRSLADTTHFWSDMAQIVLFGPLHIQIMKQRRKEQALD